MHILGRITMDKYDYIESIISFLRGITGINYQLQIKEILAVYYRSLGKTYEMPDYYGGDQKNDGWVVEDSIFYQIYAPTRLKNTLRQEIHEKFVDDLTGLLKHICDEKKWNGEIKQFVFIVNTFDGNLPHDSERFFETEVKRLQKKYNISFLYKVVNTDYIRQVLQGITKIEVLEQISASLRIRSMIDYNAITETMMMDLIMGISGNLNNKIMIGKSAVKEYTRISPVKKIDINQLEDKREEIENIISKLDVVENAVTNINQDILCENKFERVKDFIVERYIIFSREVQGVDLYEKLVDDVLTYSNDRWNLSVAIKFLIVYIFDKCDIFEKE